MENIKTDRGENVLNSLLIESLDLSVVRVNAK